MMEEQEAQREKVISGEASTRERAATLEEAARDSALREELADQQRLDGALQALLGSPEQDRKTMVSVMKKVRGGKGGGITLAASLGRVAALVLVSLGAGVLSGRYWPGGSPDSDEQETAKSRRIVERPEDRLTGGLAEQHELLGRMAESNPEEMARLFREAASLPPGRSREIAREIILYRWAEVDPRGALKVIREEREIRTLFAAWARVDADEALAGIAELGSAGLRSAARVEILDWLSGTRPDRFLELAKESPPGADAWKKAFAAVDEGGGMAEEFLASVSPRQRGAAIGGIAEILATRNPDEALSWAQSLEGTERKTALRASFGTIMRHDPQLAGMMLKSFPERLPKVESQLIDRLVETDTSEAFAWVRSLPDAESRSSLMRELGLKLAQTGNQMVFQLYDELVEAEGPRALVGSDWFQTSIWSSSGLDYEQGIDWVQNLPDEVFVNRGATERGMIFSWAKHDMAGVLRYIDELPNEGRSNNYRTAIVHHMLSMNHPIAGAWEVATAMPEGSRQRAASMTDVVMYQAKSRPALAAARYEELPPESDFPRVVNRIAGAWGAMAPKEAARWAESLPDSDLQTAAVERVASVWSDNDMFRAAEWISSLEDGLGRDRAIGQLVKNVAPLEADAAFLWAVMIKDPEVREQAGRQTMESWAAQGGIGAQAAIAESVTDPGERQKLLEILNQHRKEESP